MSRYLQELANRLRGRLPQKNPEPARQAGRQGPEVSRSQSAREVSGPASAERQPQRSAVEKLSPQDRATLEGIGAKMQAAGVLGANSASPPAKTQESDYSGNREHGKHKGNVLAPAPGQVQQNSTAAQQPAVENKTPSAKSTSKQEALDQAKAYAEKATAQKAAGHEAKAPDKGQQKEQAHAVRKAPTKGRDR